MSPSPLVSILLPVYNGETFVKDAIVSIKTQTFEDWELIIVDDGSVDDSLAVCRAEAIDEARISVFCNTENLGLAKTMNRLVTMAQGKYIAIQEQDDISVPDRLEQEVTLLEKRKAVYLVSGVAAWMNDEGEVFTHFPGRLHRGIPYPSDKQAMVAYLYTDQCKVVNAACMFRREILTEMPTPFDERANMSVDWQFFLHVAHRWQIAGIPKVLVKMRRGGRHAHLTSQKELQFAEARRCIYLVYKQYKDEPHSPIRPQLFRQAMATELILEGRFYGRFKGVYHLLQALYYSPVDKRIWLSLGELLIRFLKK